VLNKGARAMMQNNLGSEVAVVLGSGVDADGKPFPATVLRALAAYELAQAHPRLTVILSGGSPPYVKDAAVSEASVMAQVLIEKGIAPERLLLEDESRDTVGNAILTAARYLHGVAPRVLYVVTSPFHAERALSYFRSVLSPAWDIRPVLSGVADDDTIRGANEQGGIEWGQRFFAGIEPGDIRGCVRKLLSERGDRYGKLAWLVQFESEEITTMCMANHDDSAVAVAEKSVRLPETVLPEHYRITLSPDLKRFTFAGEVDIDLRVKEATDTVVLNAVDLAIRDAYVTDAAGTRLNGTVTIDKHAEQASISFAGKVGKGKWRLHLAFKGELSTKLAGFYRSTYKAGGKEHVIASTQFEPNDARRAFPCFDEPMFKATFQVTLIVDESLTAISNGPILSETLVPGSRMVLEETHADGFLSNEVVGTGKKVVEFGTTMKMSTYLVAFVVGEFEATDPIVVNGTEVRVFCVPGKKHLATFGLKAAQFSLTWFERYFGIKYPGDKLDLVGIPDFAFGAMENLGCVTFRETALLVSEETATIAELSRVAEVVAHEIAHMWFGDLVTMEWWNALWLNEAFATFMATKVEHDFRREWDRWTNFGIERAAALRTDGLGSTRPMEAAVINPASALGMIDVITYRKGCSVLRQLEQFIGETTFRNGIRAYLKKHAYANAKAGDLWDALDSVSEHPVREIMESWVLQPGYPVVTVSESDVTGCVTLSQRPFKYLAEKVDAAQRWLVPVLLRYKTADGEDCQWVLLDGTQKTIYLGENLDWVVANAHGHGFYRTLYSPGLTAKLVGDVQNNLSAIERFNLVNDAWACVLAGLSTAEQFLDSVELFTDETDPNVWTLLQNSLNRMHDLLPERNRSLFAKVVRKLVTPQYTRLGWEAKDSDSVQDRQVRGIVISMLGTIGHDTRVADKADELFASYKTDRSAVASDVVPAVIALVAYDGGAAEYAELLRLYEQTNNPQEKVRFLGALAGFRHTELLEQTLKATITPTVRTQDAPSLLVRLLGNGRISTQTWSFIKENWAHMVGNYPETGMISLVSGVAALDRPELEEDVQSFFAGHPVKGGDKAIAQNLETLRINVQFKEREAGVLAVRFALPVVPDDNIIAPSAQVEGDGPPLVRQTQPSVGSEAGS
jgi:puromycin-sensitive aminopeptidase